jgi:hypothetical protein
MIDAFVGFHIYSCYECPGKPGWSENEYYTSDSACCYCIRTMYSLFTYTMYSHFTLYLQVLPSGGKGVVETEPPQICAHSLLRMSRRRSLGIAFVSDTVAKRL